MKHSSRQFGNQFSGFGRQSEKFTRIGACIRRNFTPWLPYLFKLTSVLIHLFNILQKNAAIVGNIVTT